MEELAVYCPSEETAARVRERFGQRGFAARYTTDAAEAERFLSVAAVMPHFDAPVAERISEMLARGCGVVVVTRSDSYAKTRSFFSGTGAVVLKLPLDAEIFSQAVAIAADVGAKLRRARNETEELKSRFDDLKLVDRAKCALIQYLRMTESEAHRFIEKQAMNKRVPKREIALEILKTYES